MTVSATTARWAYNGNGVTTAFAYTTKIFAKTDLDVYVDGTLKTVDTHYTVSGVGDDAGGNVTFTVGNVPASGTGNVVIVKDVPKTQGTSMPLGGALPSEDIEDALDKVTILVQQVDSKATRVLRQPDSDATDITALPAKADRASKILQFDSDGNPTAAVSATTTISGGSGISVSGAGVVALDIAGLTDETSVASNDTVAFRDTSAGANREATIANLVAPVARKQGLETIWIPAVAMWGRTTNGAATGSAEAATSKETSKSLDFDQTTQEFAQFVIRFPKSWNEGTVTFAPIWSAASGTGGVVFGLAGVALSDDDALDTAFGTAQTSTDTLIATGDVHVGPTSSAITIAGTPAAGDLVFFQVNRTVSDGSDTLNADARLLGVVLFFTTDAADDT